MRGGRRVNASNSEVVPAGVAELAVREGLGQCTNVFGSRLLKVTVGDGKLLFFEHGLIVFDPGKDPFVMRWDNGTVKEDNTALVGTMSVVHSRHYLYRLTNGEGRTLTLTGGKYPGADIWGPLLQEKVLRAQFPLAVAAIERGETVTFGRVSLSARGITAPRQLARSWTLPWHEVARPRVVSGSLLFNRAGQLVGTGTDIKVREIPNFHLCYALIQYYTNPESSRAGGGTNAPAQNALPDEVAAIAARAGLGQCTAVFGSLTVTMKPGEARLFFFEHGLVAFDPRKEAFVTRWDEVVVTQSVSQTTTPFHSFALTNRDGRKIKLDSMTYPQVQVWGKAINENVLRARFPAALAAVEKGETLWFGPVGISAQGVTAPRRLGFNLALSWPEVALLRVSEGYLCFQHAEKVGLGSRIEVRKIPDFYVCFALMQYYTGGNAV